MELINAQLSIKFPQIADMRRKAIQIEDFLSNNYNNLQMFPIPDDFAPDAPRIVLTSKGGHSTLTFSLISVTIAINFDNEYIADFKKTKEYIISRANEIIRLLKHLNINEYYYCGVVYNIEFSTDTAPVNYIASNLKSLEDAPVQELYDASWRETFISGDFFLNKQTGVQKKLEGENSAIPELMDFKRNKILDEKVSITLDINNRYSYMKNGSSKDSTEISGIINQFYNLIEQQINELGAKQ